MSKCISVCDVCSGVCVVSECARMRVCVSECQCLCV